MIWWGTVHLCTLLSLFTGVAGHHGSHWQKQSLACVLSPPLDPCCRAPPVPLPTLMMHLPILAENLGQIGVGIHADKTL